jgi:hypothetical protein
LDWHARQRVLPAFVDVSPVRLIVDAGDAFSRIGWFGSEKTFNGFVLKRRSKFGQRIGVGTEHCPRARCPTVVKRIEMPSI